MRQPLYLTRMDFELPLLADHDDKSSPLGNRIRKNYRHARKWANRTHTSCFRIYDRDIKEYPLVIDFYAGHFLIQFFTTSRESDDPPLALQNEVETVLSTLFERPLLTWRTRIKREKTEQYEKIDHAKEFFQVEEYGVKFWVNLTDYLDTGLFLDHRETRQQVAAIAKGKRLLNLFAYTCSFSVHAAVQGAAFTKSVDMSNTYTKWGEDNFKLNHLSLANHPIVRADCLRFLEEEKERYDVIICDPPTVSRSKKMGQFFDIQIDYIYLISKCLELLLPQGVLFFSTNMRQFKFDASEFPDHTCLDISQKTIPFDFHQQKIHRCWKITKAL